MKLSEKLESLREATGLSAREVARRLGMDSPTTLGRWLSGESEPRLTDAMTLARFFRVPLDYLADDAMDEVPASSELAHDESAALGLYHHLCEHIGVSAALRELAVLAAEVTGHPAAPALARRRPGSFVGERLDQTNMPVGRGLPQTGSVGNHVHPKTGEPLKPEAPRRGGKGKTG